MVIFLNCYLAAPWPTLDHCWGGSLTHLILITCVLHIRPEGHQEPHNEVGSLTKLHHDTIRKFKLMVEMHLFIQLYDCFQLVWLASWLCTSFYFVVVPTSLIIFIACSVAYNTTTIISLMTQAYCMDTNLSKKSNHKFWNKNILHWLKVKQNFSKH